MNILSAAIVATILYLCCTILLLLRLKQVPAIASISTRLILIPGFLAVAAHAMALQYSMISPIGINFGFYNAASLVAAFITVFTLISALRHPVEILAIFMMPIASLAITLDIANSATHLLPPGSSNGLLFHVLSSLIAYSVLGLAALHAILLSIQNNNLHSHQPGGFTRLLPPLKTMESLLFETIIIGFICLSISLATGLIFLENMFAQQLAHKTVLSIIAWCVFAILLFGHWILGWRGRTAIRWTLSGFLSLMLAYFGSKFVLEIVLTSA